MRTLPDERVMDALAHELRAPLNAILGWTSLLKQGLDPDRTRRAIEVIERNARAQAALLEGLVDIARAGAGRLTLHPKPVNLVTVVTSALQAVESVGRARRVTLTAEVLPVTCVIAGDDERLGRALLALLHHAVRASPANSVVSVSLASDADVALLTVTSEWRTASPGRLKQIFDAPIVWPEPAAGFGLELAMARQIVEAHGGRMDARTTADNRVAISMHLPCRTGADAALSAEQAAAAAVAEPARHAGSLDGRRILILEDHEDTREVTAHALGERGAEVRAFGSADDALRAMREWHPHLLLVDIALPVVDGYEFIRRVRSLDEPVRTVPAVALTAFARPVDRERALREGFDVHVAKPLDTDHLVNAIHRVLVSRADVRVAGAEGD